MKIDWKFVEDAPPLHCGLPCLVCSNAGVIDIAEYHSEPEGWYGDQGDEVYNVVAYVYLHDLPRPKRPVITNDEWVTSAAKSGMLK